MSPVLVLLVLLLSWSSPLYADEFDSGYAEFAVTVDGLENPYHTMAFYVMPGEVLEVNAPANSRLESSSMNVKALDNADWQLVAPQKPGLYTVRVIHPSYPQTMTLNMFVLRPATEIRNGMLNGYRIGEYPKEPFRGLASYRPPKGFIEAHKDVLDTKVSPHFTLRQFLCKQSFKGDKQYLVLREELLIKLETILKAVNERGIRTDSFYIMSGYRTPYYNKAIGNRKYSRHIYGGAADIFIDVSPKDGRMDDLNQDGKVDKRDANFLYNLVEKLSQRSWWPSTGGLGQYGSNSGHGPFVHVDSRGYRARWGK